LNFGVGSVITGGFFTGGVGGCVVVGGAVGGVVVAGVVAGGVVAGGVVTGDVATGAGVAAGSESGAEASGVVISTTDAEVGTSASPPEVVVDDPQPVSATKRTGINTVVQRRVFMAGSFSSW
jgi:hypothetical protein